MGHQDGGTFEHVTVPPCLVPGWRTMLVPAFAAGIEPMSSIGDGRDNLNIPTADIYRFSATSGVGVASHAL
jgi:hypothetical protein